MYEYLLASITILTLYSVLLILYLYRLFHILDCTGFMEMMMICVHHSLFQGMSIYRSNQILLNLHPQHFKEMCVIIAVSVYGCVMFVGFLEFEVLKFVI
jgi:hypothetical protein